MHPHAYEVAYQYQSIHTDPVDVLAGLVKVYNEYFFIDLSRYMMEWSIEVDGAQVLYGAVPSLNVAPQTTAEVSLGYDKEDILEAAGIRTLDRHDG